MNKNINSEIVEQIFQLYRSTKQKESIKALDCEISPLQLFTLYFINSSKTPIHMKDIADHLSVEMPTATSLLDKVVKMGLVKRVSDKKDRRVVEVAITPKGKKVLDKAMEIRTRNMGKYLDFLPNDQKQHLNSILKTLNKLKNIKVDAKAKVKVKIKVKV